MTTITIIGRPNVGKSTLVNTLTEERSVVTSAEAGTTRDTVELVFEWIGKKAQIIDTGGFSFDETSDIQKYINQTLSDSIEKSDIIFFVVDGRVTKTETDLAIAKQLKRLKKPIFLLVNKIDSYQKELEAYDYQNLGFDHTYFISGLTGYGIGDLLDAAFSDINEEPEKEEDKTIRFAFFGKPNAGKSSLFNAIIEKERVLVSEEAGTTVDMIEHALQHKGHNLSLLDTAGIKKTTKVGSGIERMARKKALTLMKKIDIACLIIDGSVPITKQDQRLARELEERYIPTLIIINKFDLLSPLDDTKNIFRIKKVLTQQIRKKLSPLYFSSIIFVSAKEHFHLQELKNKIIKVYSDYHKEINEADLKDFLSGFLLKYPPRSKRHLNPPTIKKIVQLQKRPDVFALITSVKGYLNELYIKNMQRKLQDYLKRDSIPIRLIVRKGKK